jgi:hypothetical protein
MGAFTSARDFHLFSRFLRDFKVMRKNVMHSTAMAETAISTCRFDQHHTVGARRAGLSANQS